MKRGRVALAAAGLLVTSCAGDDSTTDDSAASSPVGETDGTTAERGDVEGTGAVGALGTVHLDGSHLVIELPATAPEYRVTAEVPATWTSLAPADADDAEVDAEAWELEGPPDTGIIVEVYDTRGTGYEVEAVPTEGEKDAAGWDSLYRFTGDTFGPPRGFIGGTEEMEIPEHRPGFDLIILDVGSDGVDEASKLVVSLDGSYFVTFTTPFGLDENADAAARAAYTTILETATVLPAEPVGHR